MLYKEEPYISVGILTDRKIKFELYGDFQVVGSKDSFSGIYTAEIKNDRILCRSSKNEVEGFDYGAVGDGTTLDTIAINTAIDACANHGSGMVYFPPGIYLSGSLHLKTNVTLFFDCEAVLRGTRDMTKYDQREYNPCAQYQDTSQSYFHRSLIWGENLSNLGILGPGMIDGNDAFEPWPIINKTFPPPFGWIFSTIFYQINDTVFQRGAKPLALKSCVNVFIKNITITHAPDESIFVAGFDNVIIKRYKAQAVRVDGIDPICCHNMTITNCEIRSLDDGIALKTHFMLGFKRSCENITVKQCLFSVFVNGIKIGTESVADFRHIIYRNCIVRNSPNLPSYAGILVICVDGGTIDNVFGSKQYQAEEILLAWAICKCALPLGVCRRIPDTDHE